MRIFLDVPVASEPGEDGERIFWDYPWAWNADVGDRIHRRHEFGQIEAYEVVEVTPAEEPNFPKELRKVRAKRVG
jgi:hypothetical protein